MLQVFSSKCYKRYRDVFIWRDVYPGMNISENDPDNFSL